MKLFIIQTDIAGQYFIKEDSLMKAITSFENSIQNKQHIEENTRITAIYELAAEIPECENIYYYTATKSINLI